MDKRGNLEMSRRIVLFLVLLLSLLSITFVGSVIMELESKYNSGLFGMHETLAYRSLYENLNISWAFEIMHSLGVRKLRMNFWRCRFMLNSTEINPGSKATIERVIHEADSLGIEIMGYAEDFPSWMTNITGDHRAVPRRNTTKYSVFLERYEKSWETLAREFPEIKVWEIGNEYNLHRFLHPPRYNESDSNTWFNYSDTVDITTDLLYYGSRGINASNPNATTVMCGLGPGGNGIRDIERFLDSLYKNIESGRWPSTNPDDFFQVASWHPYISTEKPTKQNWVDPNKAVYEIMKKHGDGDKRVVFSEMGYTDNNLSRNKIAEYFSEVFKLAKNNFPWLDTIYWYRLTDRDLIYEGQKDSKMDGYGVIESPETWTWKPAAYAYESLTHPFPWWTLSLVSGISLLIVIAVFVLYLVKSGYARANCGYTGLLDFRGALSPTLSRG